MPLTDSMPTAAKFFAAIGLGIVGWVGSDAIRPLLPEQTDFGWFNFVNLGLGILIGWRVVGRRVGGTFSEAISAGLTGAAALVFWGLFAQSFNLMLKKALEKRYDGPFEGVLDIFKIGTEYGVYLLDGTVIGIIAGGGILVGIFADWIAKRYH